MEMKHGIFSLHANTDSNKMKLEEKLNEVITEIRSQNQQWVNKETNKVLVDTIYKLQKLILETPTDEEVKEIIKKNSKDSTDTYTDNDGYFHTVSRIEDDFIELKEK